MVGEAQIGFKFNNGNVKDCKRVLLELWVPQHPANPNLDNGYDILCNEPNYVMVSNSGICQICYLCS